MRAARQLMRTAGALLLLGCQSPAGSGPPEPAPTQFLFASDRSGSFEIYRSVAGTVTRLTNEVSVDSWWPRRSPDGQQILFYRSAVADRPPSGNGQNNYAHAALWAMGSDGSGAHVVVAEGANGWTDQGVADWSPDGTRLVMAAIDPGEGQGRWHLYLTNADGSQPTRISRRVGLYLDPSWSPDGTRIVYVGYPEGVDGFDLSRLEVFTMAIDGSDERRLTNDAIRDHDPYWSPDGNEIAFESAVDPTFLVVGKWALRGVRPDGQGLRTILDDGNINTLPRWSPDGARIFFHRLVFGASSKFVIAEIAPDGSELISRTAGGSHYDDVDPSPY